MSDDQKKLEQRLARVDQQINAVQDVLYRICRTIRTDLPPDARKALISELEGSGASLNESENGLADELATILRGHPRQAE
ncbi:hypothetical protein F1645_06160 [Novacetimonas hansenii]|uniref:Uncharacterized protein n=1 Tax=Novacetimonas hansenii TaxID=436 RepID=A0ABQ0SIY0_NOVHA|nr:hypothetical protein [Novacetimonas hansenii]GAN84811.1 hypothetical protein Gaha_0232_011 [Novacetimonas hansenii JCM 7643]GEC65226.1 hypothetical protein GHA01_30750 [Novacetimonas hansenii]